MAEPWSKFFWSDWEADQGLRLSSLAAQGLWMRMLCVCAEHEPKGYLAINGHPLTVDAIARLAGVAETEAENLLAELERNGVFSRNRSGCIYSRRMVRDEKRSQEGRKHKKRGLSQVTKKQAENPRPSRGATRGPLPHIPEARSQKDSEADASAADGGAGEDFAKVLFDRGVAFLGKHGVPERQARSVVGLWRKDHPDSEIFDAFAACSKAGAVDPIPWIAARLGGTKIDIREMMKGIGNA